MQAKVHLLSNPTNGLRLLAGIVEVESEIERRRGASGKSRSRISPRRVDAANLALKSARRQSEPLDAIVDHIGSVDGLPPDLSARKKRYLKTTGYGGKRVR